MSEPRTRGPGRPRLFDEETALDAITELFWRKGYSQTSMADIVEVSGVQKPSLYRVFGSKEEIFALVLRRYFSHRMNMFATLIEHCEPGLQGIHQFLSLMRDDVVSGTSQNGCLLVESSAELRGTTPGFEDFGPAYREAVRILMEQLVSKACGPTGKTLTRSSVLATWFLGLDLSVRGNASVEEIDRNFDAMHSLVNSWGSGPREQNGVTTSRS